MTMTPLFFLMKKHSYAYTLHPIPPYILPGSNSTLSFLSQNLQPFILIQTSFHSHTNILSFSHFIPFHIVTPSHTFYPFTLTHTKPSTLAHSFISLGPPCVLKVHSPTSSQFKSFQSHTSHALYPVALTPKSLFLQSERFFFRSLKLTAFPFHILKYVLYSTSTLLQYSHLKSHTRPPWFHILFSFSNSWFPLFLWLVPNPQKAPCCFF